jgi:hypothetical protein
LEKDTRQRSKLKAWAPAALGLAVLVAGAVVFASTRDTRSSFESPLTIYEIMGRQGYECRIQPGGLGMILRDDKDTILCVPPSAEQGQATAIQTFADPAELDADVRFAQEDVPPGDEDRSWILGKNWVVKLPRATASDAVLRRLAEVLGGDVFVPGAGKEG